MVVVVQACQPGWEDGFDLRPHRDAYPTQDSVIFTTNHGYPHNKYMKFDKYHVGYKGQTIHHFRDLPFCVINTCPLLLKVLSRHEK